MSSFRNYVRKNFLFFVILVFLINLFLSNNARAAYVLDSDAGTYTDDFANNTGVPTRSYVNVNTAIGVLQLTSASNQTTFTTPYAASGNAITRVIKPVLIAEWGTLSITATIPTGTTLRAQITDDSNYPWTDDVLSGNFDQGIDLSETTEIDLSSIPVLYCAKVENTFWGGEIDCSKTSALKIKFIMTTSDTAVTPSVTGISMNWTRTQGDFEQAEISENDSWSTDYGDQQKTSSSQYYNPNTYPVFKWISEKHSGDFNYSSLYVTQNKLVGYVNDSEGRLFSLDRETGEEQWKTPGIFMVYPPGAISSDGTLYGVNATTDHAISVDTNNGEIKWVYNWMGGHGSGMVVGEDGDIYYLRDEANSPNATLVDQNPDGTIESQTVLPVVSEGLTGETKSISSMVLSPNNIAYFVTYVSNSTTHEPNLKSRLFAVSLDTKEILWSYLGIFDEHFIVDSEGTAYVFSHSTWGGDSTTKKIVAVKSDGTLKWERDSGTGTEVGYCNYYSPPILREDGIIMVYRVINSQVLGYDPFSSIVRYPGSIEMIDSRNGNLVGTLENNRVLLFADGLSGYYHYDNYATPDEGSSYSYKAELAYANSENNQKWEIKYPYSTLENGVGKSVLYNFSKLAPDERGWLYGGFVKIVNTTGYKRVRSETSTKTYALAPWTLSDHSDIAGERKPGDVLNFNVSSNMLKTNPVFGEDNKVQVYMSNGDKILLSSNSVDSNGNTVWTGSYIIPANFLDGSATYTIEASQSYLQTDVPTHFDEAPKESNNTGIIIAKGFINDATLPSNKTGNISIKFGNNKKTLKKIPTIT